MAAGFVTIGKRGDRNRTPDEERNTTEVVTKEEFDKMSEAHNKRIAILNAIPAAIGAAFGGPVVGAAIKAAQELDRQASKANDVVPTRSDRTRSASRDLVAQQTPPGTYSNTMGQTESWLDAFLKWLKKLFS